MRDIHSYIYNMSILKGSGEFCICESSVVVVCFAFVLIFDSAYLGPRSIRESSDHRPDTQGRGSRRLCL